MNRNSTIIEPPIPADFVGKHVNGHVVDPESGMVYSGKHYQPTPEEYEAGKNRKKAAAVDGQGWDPVHLTELDNAKRLVAVLRGRARFNVSRGRWMAYENNRFVVDDKGNVDNCAKLVARQTGRFIVSPPEGITDKQAIAFFAHPTRLAASQR